MTGPWFPRLGARDLDGREVLLPAIGRQWQPARQVIDGAMAAAIGDQQTRRRTLTVYTGLRRVTAPLGIGGQGTIWLFLADRAGRVRHQRALRGRRIILTTAVAETHAHHRCSPRPAAVRQWRSSITAAPPRQW